MLYGRKGEVPNGDAALVPIGRAAVRRSGGDVTIAAALRAVETALSAAEELATEGIEADVIDLRTLPPPSTWRRSPSRPLGPGGPSSPRKGRRPAATRPTSSPRRSSAGPLAARRVTVPDILIPFSPPLEDRVIPDTADIVAAALLGAPR
jgi:pyruvate/2-oxoglutarate/acetoin dehydrogenase E1 component